MFVAALLIALSSHVPDQHRWQGSDCQGAIGLASSSQNRLIVLPPDVELMCASGRSLERALP